MEGAYMCRQLSILSFSLTCSRAAHLWKGGSVLEEEMPRSVYIISLEVMGQFMDPSYDLRCVVTWRSQFTQTFISDEPIGVGTKTEGAGSRPVFLLIRYD
ncbi:hypothetical protein TNCV_1479361 [Trichonephila clavipes]|nr:hypothetical protein TNCV_1479361 [Trichonephila clavipes]